MPNMPFSREHISRMLKAIALQDSRIGFFGKKNVVFFFFKKKN